MDNVIAIFKAFAEKIPLWLTITIFSSTALFYENFLSFLGLNEYKCVLGFLTILSSGFSIQGAWDVIVTHKKRNDVLSHFNDLTKDEESFLQECLSNKRRSYMHNNGITRLRLISRGLAEQKGDFAVFPDFVWTEMRKRYGDKK